MENKIKKLLENQSAKMWFYEAIYQTWHLEIPTLGIFELPRVL
jgi:hypothetical protein